MRSNRKLAELATYMIVGVIVLSLILLRMTGQMLFGWIAVVSPFVWLIFEDWHFSFLPYIYCGMEVGSWT